MTETSADDLAAQRALLLTDAVLPRLIDEQSRRQGDKIALEVDGVQLSYTELRVRAASVASRLIGRGLGDAERVAICAEDSIDMVVACLAVMWAGGVEVVINPALREREVRHILQDADVRFAFVDRRLLNVSGAYAAVTALDLATVGTGPWLEAAELDRHSERLRRCDASGPASLQYTSGTTGTPKGALLSHGNIVAYLRAILTAWHWVPDDVLLHSLPLSHGHGRNGVYTALLAGATAIVHRRTEAARLIEELPRATVFYAVPAIWERLLSSGRLDPAAFPRLRLATSGSAPLSPAVSDQLRHILGERPVERYGTTETGIVTTNPYSGPRHRGTVGLPLPGVEIRIADDEGAGRPEGEPGEVLVRGPSVFSGYLGIESGDCFAGEWFKTGDIGYFDPARSGYLCISGRAKEMIISGGLNVYPREVELVAEAQPGVREAGVVGIASQKWGEEVVMIVVPEVDGELSPDELLGLMKGELAAYKVPKQCVFVDEIPRNQMGKILRRQISEGWSPPSDR